MPSLQRARLLLIGFSALIGFALVLLARDYARGTAPLVPVVSAKTIELETSIATNGKIEPIDGHVFSAQFETTVVKVYATEGQQIRAGQALLTLDSSEKQADLTQARLLDARFARQKAQLQYMRTNGQLTEVFK